MATVSIRNVRKRFGTTEVLHGVSVEIEDGEFVILVGPSGCGKSTLLRMIAGLENISDGEIAIGGRVVNNVAPKERDIAMVFQNYALYPHMTAFDNMAYGLRIRGLSRDEIRRKVDEAADLLGLGALLARKPRQLSGGERQRVAVVRALINQPQLLLADEPTGSLDHASAQQLGQLLLELNREEGVTLIVVTHALDLARLMGRVFELKDGRLAPTANGG